MPAAATTRRATARAASEMASTDPRSEVWMATALSTMNESCEPVRLGPPSGPAYPPKNVPGVRLPSALPTRWWPPMSVCAAGMVRPRAWTGKTHVNWASRSPSLRAREMKDSWSVTMSGGGGGMLENALSG